LSSSFLSRRILSRRLSSFASAPASVWRSRSSRFVRRCSFSSRIASAWTSVNSYSATRFRRASALSLLARIVAMTSSRMSMAL